MARLKLIQMMETPLEPISHQKKKPYRPSIVEVKETFNILNYTIFEWRLLADLNITNCLQKRHYHGFCESIDPPVKSTITINDKWYCKQWMIMILAHEMCHQYQWEVLGNERIKENRPRLLSHGPSFYILRDKLESYNIPLKRVYNHHHYLNHEHRSSWSEIWRPIFKR